MARRAKTADGSTPSGGAEAVVQRTLNQLAPGIAERQTRRLRLDKAYAVWLGEPWAPVMNPQQRITQNTWQSRLRVKWAMSIVDQALANVVQGVPKAKVTPRLPGYEDSAVAMEKLLAYYADLDHLAEKEYPIAQQGMVYGLSPAKTHWLYTETPQRANGFVTDPDTGETIPGVVTNLEVTADRPTMEPWDAYSIFWDPTAGSVDECAYIVLESWKTRDELEQGRFNEQDGTGQWRNLDLLYQTGDGGQPYAKTQNQILQEPPVGAWIGKFRIWEVWRKTAQGMRLTVIGNRQVMLRDGPSPYWMNSYPVTVSNTRPDLFKLEGISETEMVDHLQQWLWTVQNLRAENWKFTVMRPATVRQTVPDMAAVIMRPGGIIPVTDHDDVRMIEFPPLPAEAYHEEESAIQMMQLVTGINQYVTGANANANETATGASLFTQNASRLLQLKASVIHNQTWQRTFEQWGMLCKQFVRRPVQVRIVGEGGTVQWMNVGPAEVNADYDIRIQAGDESITKQQDRADMIAFLNSVAPFAQMGIVNFQPLFRKLAEDFGFPNPDEIVQAAMQPPQAAPFGGGQQQIGSGPSPFTLGQNGGALGTPHLAPHPLASVLQGNQ